MRETIITCSKCGDRIQESEVRIISIIRVQHNVNGNPRMTGERPIHELDLHKDCESILFKAIEKQLRVPLEPTAFRLGGR